MEEIKQKEIKVFQITIKPFLTWHYVTWNLTQLDMVKEINSQSLFQIPPPKNAFQHFADLLPNGKVFTLPLYSTSDSYFTWQAHTSIVSLCTVYMPGAHDLTP